MSSQNCAREKGFEVPTGNPKQWNRQVSEQTAAAGVSQPLMGFRLPGCWQWVAGGSHRTLGSGVAHLSPAQVLARKPSWSLLATKRIITVWGFGNSLMFCQQGTWGLSEIPFFQGAVMVVSGSDGAGAVSVKWKGEEGRWSLSSGLKLHPCPSEQRLKSLSWLSLSPGHLTMVQLGTSCLTYLCVSFSTTKVT